MLPENESRILRWVGCVVEEAYSYLDPEDEDDTEENQQPLHQHSPPPALGLAVIRLWARFFKRNVQWRFVNIIGASLDIYEKGIREELRTRPP
jgi:hypothetical protein